MPAVSKAQQKFMGIVHGLQKGDVKPSDVSTKAKKVAKSISKKDAKDFAATKHKGLPEKVPENYIVDENTLTDLPDDVEYGYTKDGVVQCVAAKNVCLTRMRDDRERNPGSKFQFIYSPTNAVGEMFEGIFDKVKSPSDKEYKIASAFAQKIGMKLDSIGVDKKTGNINIKGDVNLRPVEMVINKYGKVVKGHNENINEIKSDQDMVKDGLKYAKKKYKYDNKKLKDLAKDTLMYIKSGEIDDQPSMEAYIDFRHDEMMMGEIKEVIRSVVRETILLEKYPAKAFDVNKVKDADAFWKLKVADANKMAGTSFGRQGEVGDVIFWLNTVAEAWENKKYNK